MRTNHSDTNGVVQPILTPPNYSARSQQQSSMTTLTNGSGSGTGSGSDSSTEDESSFTQPTDEIYKRKRLTLRPNHQHEGATLLLHQHTNGNTTPGSAVDEDEDADDDEIELKGWPSTNQIKRRLRLTWNTLRLATVLKLLTGVILLLLLIRGIIHQIQDRHKANHFTIVALLREKHPNSGMTPPFDVNQWQSIFQWSAVMSWNEVVVGRNILVFVDDDATCDFVESQVRDIQCYVIPPIKCYHSETKKPRLDCIFSIAHMSAPTDTIVYINSDVLIGPDLSAAISVVQSKYDRFFLTGRRTDLTVTGDMFDSLRRSDFVHKLIQTAKTSGHLHKPNILDVIVYQRSEFTRNPALAPFPPFIATSPTWDNWFYSLAILDETMTTIDVSESVVLVHLDRGKPHHVTRVGASHNEELVRRLVGNNWRVGTNIENARLALVGDCQQGAAPTMEPAITSPQTPGSTTYGCSIVRNPNITDMVLFTQRASKSGVLVVVSVNSGYLPLAMNWLCWIERIQFTNYIILAEDVNSYTKLRALQQPVVLMKDAPPIKTASEYGSISFQEHISARTEYLMEILNAGFHFLVSDVDEIWLDNPLKFMDLNQDIQGQVLRTSTDSSSTTDTIQVNGGFLFVRSSTNGRYFWKKVLECQHQNQLFLRAHILETIPTYDVERYTESYCINSKLHQVQTHGVNATFLDPYLFADGSSFFVGHESQLRGITPVVIHNNFPTHSVGHAAASVQAKLHRLQQWGLHSYDDDTKRCLGPDAINENIRGHLSGNGLVYPNLKVNEGFQLKIRLITYHRPEALTRLLDSLQAADFGSDQITLEISIDHPIPTPHEEDVTKWNEVTVIANSFQWSHGKKLVIEQPHNIGLGGQWTHGWIPKEKDDSELCLFLQDDTIVSPDFYRWLKPAIERYYLDPSQYDPRMFGISLERQETILGESYRSRYGSRTPTDMLIRFNHGQYQPIYKYQLLGSSGVVFFPNHWRAFQAWLEMKEVDTIQGISRSSSNVACVPSLLSNRWWRMNPHRAWTQWFIRFTYEMGWYSLYAHFEDGHELVTKQNAPGAIVKKSKVTPLTDLHLNFPNTTEIPIFDFHFNQAVNPAILVYRPFVTNEKFIGVTHDQDTQFQTEQNQQCWTVDDLVQQQKREAETRRLIEVANQAKLVKAEPMPTNTTTTTPTSAAKGATKSKESGDKKVDTKSKTKSKSKGDKKSGDAKSKDKPDKAATEKAKKLAAEAKEKAKYREVDDHLHAPKDRLKARKDELQAMVKLPEKKIAAFFDEADPDTARHLRYLSTLKPILSSFPKGKFLTVSDGRFGLVANYISKHMDKDSKVTASEIIDPTLVHAKEKLKTITNFQVVDPSKTGLDAKSFDFVFGMESIAHDEKPMQTIQELLRIAKRGVVLIEPQDTKFDKNLMHGQCDRFKRSDICIAVRTSLIRCKLTLFVAVYQLLGLPDSVKKALSPLVGHAGNGTGVRLDANELIKYTEKSKLDLYFHVFRTDADIELAKKVAKSGARPYLMMTTLILKKSLPKKLHAAFFEAGFIHAQLNTKHPDLHPDLHTEETTQEKKSPK